MKTKKEIMKEISDAMTGNPARDFEIVADILEKYADHPEVDSIAYEILAKITERIPTQALNEMNRIMEESHRAIENRLMDVEELIEECDFDQALEKIEALFRSFQMLDMFNEDTLFQFFTFEDGLQESVYRVIHNIKTPTGNAPANYGKAYFLHGKVLLGLHRLEEAKEKFEMALRWNPMHIPTYIAYAQVLKVEGLQKESKDYVCKGFRYAYKKEDLGDIYCFLASLFVEEDDFEIANYCAFFSSFYARKSKANKYMRMVKEACPYKLATPEPGRLSQVFEEHGIEKAPGEEMLRVLFSIASYCEGHNRLRECLFVWNTIHDLLEDKDSLQRVEELEDKILAKLWEIIQDYMDHPCEHKFNRIILELRKLNVYAALKKDTKDEYAIATRDGQTYFVLFTRKEIDPNLMDEYRAVKVPIEQVIQWISRNEEDIAGIVFNPDEDGLSLEMDELSSFVKNDMMS